MKLFIEKRKWTLAIFFTLLMFFGTYPLGYADVTPVSKRTPQVRDAIVATVPGVNAADDVTEAHLAAITRLNMRGKNIAILKADDFDGLTALRNLNLYNNQLSRLPHGIFEGLTALTTLRLGGNIVDPLPIPVALEKVVEGQFKAVASTGATFDYVLSITVRNGSITGGATTVRIPQGRVESEPLTVTRTPGTMGAVTVDIQTLPRLPSDHYGYALVTFDPLPLSVIARINTAPVFIDGRSVTRSVAENTAAGTNIGAAIAATDAENDALTYTLSGADASALDIDRSSHRSYRQLTRLNSGADVSAADANVFDIDAETGQLKTKAALDFETKKTYAVTLTVSDGELTDTITVTIHVTDVNEIPPPPPPPTNNAPVFTDGTSTTRSIAENTPSDQNIGAAIAATDADNDTLTYSLSGTDAAAFSIVSTSGQLQTKNALDFETKSSYSVTVSASDGNSGTDSITVSINVTDTNDAPIFTDGTTTTRAVAENTASDQNIGAAIAATDADNDTLIYTLIGADASAFDLDRFIRRSYRRLARLNRGADVSAADADVFDIDAETGQLKTKATLDFETKKTYSVMIAVSDGNVTDTITVTIHVTDVNEIPPPPPPPINNAPVFTDGDSTTRSVAENTTSGTDIGTPVAATDADNDTLTYTLGGADAASFSIVSTSGQLRTSAALDYETKNAYSVTVSVSDGKGGSDSITVTISVTDVNEPPPPTNNAPVFTDGISTTRSVAENTASGQNIGSAVAATDADNDVLTYTLGGTDADSFGIVSTSGQLQTRAALDYETKKSYSVTVSVSDGKGGSDSITVTINVTDVNETPPSVNEDPPPPPPPTNNAPVFTDGTNTTRSVAENTAAGTNIGSAVAATDADNDVLTYTLGGTDADSFSIVITSGQLQTNAALDYETKNVYSVTVSVSDGNDGSDSIDVTINVTDVNEDPPPPPPPTNNAPVFTDGTNTTRSVAENTAAGTNIGSAVAATDADNDTLTYTLSGTDAAAFGIVSTSGQLQTRAALDYETKNVYSVTVSVSDGNGGSDSIDVTINVTDVNEDPPPPPPPTNNAPVFTDGTSTTRSVAENTASGQNIGSAVAATDADNDTLTYTLSGDDADSFGIVSTSGQLQTKAALDHETDDSYSVTVSVSDGNGGSDAIDVTISVTNVNDNAPVFTDGETTTRSINENTAAEQNIGTAVAATDQDGNTITYTLGGTDAAAFDIVSTSGQLQTKAALDYETKKSYSVTITVSDGTLTDSITVTITVSNVNEAPSFTDGSSTTRSVAENTASGRNIGKAVAATDPESDTLTYTLGGTDAGSFSIVDTSGQLQTSAALDYETKNSYSVTVTASDGTLTDSITVTITVSNVNENNAPIFTEGTSTTRSVVENTASGQNIGTALAATDADNDTLTYTLGGTDSASFSIVSTSGQLQTSAALDHETKASYSVTVSVSDGNGGSDSIDVTIRVTDANDAPVFTDGTSTTRAIAENTVANTNIGTAVGATDDDGDPITYSLGGDDASSFGIVGASGQLRTKAALDRETKASYSVTVTATSSGNLTDSIDVTINVTNVNEAPSFTDGSSTTRSIAENTASGTNIGTAVGATDPDGDMLTYTLGGTDAGSFGIVGTSGQLQTSAALDHETKASYSVSVSVSDGNGGSNSIDVTINVTEVNEDPTNNAPVFTDGTSTTRSIAENTDSGTNIGSAVAATDADGDMLTYTLGGTDAGSFGIVGTSGQLQTSAALNFETKNAYSVRVSVSDGKGGSDAIDVTINITDVNETPVLTNNAPVFTDGDSTTRSIAENTAASTNIGTAVAATDADNDTLTYTLSGTDAGSFSIVSTSGQLQTSAALDFETKSSYSVRVSVSDGNSEGSDAIDVTITVTNANDAPVFTEGTSTTRSVAENTAAEQNIGTAVGATDDDGDTITYSLGGDDAAAFSIVSTSGQLQTKAALDRENKSSYSVTVKVSDGNLTDSIDVTINVSNVNEAPSFASSTATRSVAENTDSGTNIGAAVAATDVDHTSLTYTLGGTDAASFGIVSNSGQLQTSGALDFESKPSYSVTVTATDAGNLSDTISVTINVTDANDAPVFTEGASTTRSIAENTASGQNIGTVVAATDEDKKQDLNDPNQLIPKDTLTYSLSGDDAGSFGIVGTSGQLQTSAALDHERKSSYSVTVSVSDGNGGSDAIDVTINVTNANDAPVFDDGDSTTRSVAENTASGRNIGTAVGATDEDRSPDPDNPGQFLPKDTLSYSLGGDDAAAFDIVSTSGQLKTQAALDRETKASYSVTVDVSDGNSGTDSIDVTINVSNVNDNAPVFTDGDSTTRSIAENTAANTNIGTAVAATDQDGDTLTYSLGGDDKDSFKIVSTSGQLQTKNPLNFESKASYSVTITVSDGSRSDTITVTINVTNVNEAPTFTEGDSTTRSIKENTAADTNIGAAVAATDVDSGTTLTYTLSGTDASSFDIVSTSGQLKTKAPLNHEEDASYSVTVSVSDGNGGSDSIDVTINVTDVNEAPVFDDGDSTTRSVDENTAANQNIGTAVGATDDDGDTITYTLGGTDAAAFSIVSTSGQLQTKAALDRETKASYSVTVTATSNGNLTDSIAVTINVSNVNEAPTFASATATRSVAENTDSGTNIGAAVAATDVDHTSLTYTLGGTDAASFSIVSTSGQLQTNAALDFESNPSYSVTVTATDAGNLSDTISVTINVTDANDAPVFTEGASTTRSIAENTASGQNIGTVVAATDEDKKQDLNDPNQLIPKDTLTYSLSGDDAGSFGIVGTSGQLQTSAALDHERKSSYSVTVSVSDGNGGSDAIDVTINVTNANDAPVFTEGDSTTRSIAENTTSGTNIGTAVGATDEDRIPDPENPGQFLPKDTLSYSLSGDDAGSFGIVGTSGQLQTSAALDFETKSSYTVTVTATDGNSGSDSIDVMISVTDANDAPVFTDGDSTTRSIAENTASGQNIGTVIAATDEDKKQDPDDPNQLIPKDTLSYSLSGDDAGSFGIVGTSGQLQTSAALDFETKSSYTVTVTATDGNSGSDSIDVMISVTDANDPPVFTDGTSTTRSVAENTTSGQNIGTAVGATDDDGDTITYTLGGTDATSFSIVSASGQLQTQAALDRETTASYSVTVTATSTGNLTDSIDVTINVTDVNDNPPTFTDGDSTTRSVAENTAADTNIGTAVGATDADNDTLTYTLGGTNAASFSIVSTSGQLQTKNALDYETKTSYSVTITVSDGGSQSDSITVTINVTDVNDAPVFTEGDSTTRSIEENTAADTNIGAAVAATDDDGDTLTYTLGGDDKDTFKIVSTSGQIQTKNALDYETQASHSVTVTASDGDLDDTITVTINITDVIEPPISTRTPWIRDAIVAAVPGVNNADDVTAAQLAAITSIDVSHNLQSLKAGDFNGLTSLTKLVMYRGYVSDISPLEHLTSLTELNLGLQEISDISPLRNLTSLTELNLAGNSVSDISPLRNLTSLKILSLSNNSVSDISPLEDLTALTHLNLGSNSISDISPLEDLTALKQLGLLNNSISDISPLEDLTSLTELNLGSNSISDISPLRNLTSLTKIYLRHNSISDLSPVENLTALEFLWVEGNPILDYGPLRRLKLANPDIDIDIDLTNNLPQFSDGDSTTRSIAENTASGTNIGTPVAATDADNDTLTYTLGGTDADSFSIVSTSGQLKTKAALDYETKSSYMVTVTVYDGNSGGDLITVTINVTDEDESSNPNSPVFTEGTTAMRSVAENTASSTNIGSAVTATDADNDTLTYTLGGTDAASFGIVSNSGQLQTSAALDFETKTSYSVTVSVSDGKGGTDSITVSINVTNVNEIDPLLSERTQEVRDAIVAAVTGVDSADDVIDTHLAEITSLSIVNQDIRSLQSGDFNGLTLLADLRLDANLISDISPLEQLTSLTTLHLSRNSISDISVLQRLTSLTILNISYNAISDISILQHLTSLTDLDISYNGISNISVLQHLTALTDILLIGNPISDYDFLRKFIADNSEVNIDINLTNNPPVFSDGNSATRSIAENTTSGTNISDPISATDTDTGDTLTYSFADARFGNTDAFSFDIDSDSGQLKTKAALDYEFQTSYTVIVDVSDGNDGLDRITVTIEITDVVNEVGGNNAPVFTDRTSRRRSVPANTTTRSVAENTAPGENIGTAVAATDADNDTLTYTLSGDDAGSFSIDSTSGQLKTKAALDYETKSSYTVTVSVSDGKGGTDRITVSINVTNVNEIDPLLSERTQEVRDAIVAAVPGVNNADDVIDTQLAAITSLNLFQKGITSLKSGDFNGLTALTTLQLESNSISDISALEDLTALTQLLLSGNPISDYGPLRRLKAAKPDVAIDVNLDNTPPVFSDGDSAIRAIAENTVSGTNIGDPISATDADDDVLTYSLSGTDADAFSIVSTSGQLQTKAALDHETQSSYTVTVSVADGNGGSDAIDVTISVTNANDAPIFTDSDSTTRSVAENTASEQNVGSAVAATDADTGDTLTYSLGGTDADAFSIVSASGQLQTKAALDYETKTSYSVTVSVSDGNGGDDSIDVRINVTDVNETPENTAPVFTDGTTATRSVAENTVSGTDIGTAVSATDADDNDVLTYTLGGTDADAFGIVSTSGQLQTKAALDYETKSSYTVTVSVSDGNGGSAAIDVAISVTDANDAPVFSDGDSTTRSVAENTVSEQNVGSVVAATDADTGDTLTYTLGGTDAAAFSIVSASGQLQTKHALDFETKSDYSVTISVSDGKGGSDSISVRISVTNINEAPRFSKTKVTLSVAEDAAVGTAIGDPFQATDPEGDPLTYSLRRGDAAAFSIDASTGQLKTNTPLDYEAKKTYDALAVRATDADGKFDAIVVTINVTDVAENTAPVFTDGDSTTRSVAENTASGQNIGTAIAATDADSGDTLTYTLGGTDAAAFGIVSTSGQLQTSAALDFETKKAYSVTITVSDGNLTDSISVTINVLDVTENRAPAFTDGDSTTRTVAENTASGQNIGTAIAATDADNDVLTYTLSGDDAAAFRIVSTSGQLQTRAAVDYETKKAYAVTVSVSDSKGGTDGITVSINVTDVNEIDPPLRERTQQVRNAIVDAAPVNNPDDVTDTQLAAIPSLNLSAKDITSLKSGDFSGLTSLTILHLNGNSISDISSLEKLEKLTLLRDLRLRGNPILDYGPLRRLKAANPNVVIDISLDNNLPVFSEGNSARRAIPGNADAGTNIGTAIAATDADGDTLTYSLGGTDAAAFSIVSTSGQLRTYAALDYETKSSYTVRVTVYDGNSGGDRITVTINVTEPNNAPVFTDGDSTTRAVAENTASGENIGTAVSATDVDSGDTLTYTLGGTDADAFSIVSTSGQLQTRAGVDYETKKAYAVTVSVSDGEGGSDSIEITINVTNVNEAPSFPRTRVTLSVAEDAAVGTAIGDPFQATDPEGGTLTYSLRRGDAAAFSIDASTGQLKTNTALDYEAKKVYDNLAVRATDAEGKFDAVVVTVNITDVHENTVPVFTDGDSTTRAVAENTAANTNIGTAIAATDQDGDVLIYTLSGTDAAAFSIVSTSGQLQTKNALDFETKNAYTVTVSVSDGNSDSDSISVRINVTNVNEAPRFSKTRVTLSVAEDATIGTAIGDPFQATDPEGGTLTYSLRRGDAAAFSIDASTGQLKTNTPLDYEVKKVYDNLAVRATDADGKFDAVIVTVNVTEVAEALAAQAVPPKTVLLPNFPNPFNPETWIPYQLSKPAKVTLTIYDIRGVVVRELKVGHQAAGFYHSRSRAIYWNGRNMFGEKVATGVYFYTLRAGDYTATRKLLIRK